MSQSRIGRRLRVWNTSNLCSLGNAIGPYNSGLGTSGGHAAALRGIGFHTPGWRGKRVRAQASAQWLFAQLATGLPSLIASDILARRSAGQRTSASGLSAWSGNGVARRLTIYAKSKWTTSPGVVPISSASRLVSWPSLRSTRRRDSSVAHAFMYQLCGSTERNQARTPRWRVRLTRFHLSACSADRWADICSWASPSTSVSVKRVTRFWSEKPQESRLDKPA